MILCFKGSKKIISLFNTAITSILVLILAGCAIPSSFYNPNNLEQNKLAKITSENIGFFTERPKASIVSVFDENDNEVITTGFGKSKHFEISLAEGNYGVILRCENYWHYSFPMVIVELKLNTTYVAYCRYVDSDDGENTIQGYILESTLPPPKGRYDK